MAILNNTPKYKYNAYLAFGVWMDYALMKVGKTVNVLNRQKGLTLRIEFSCPLLDGVEGTAYEAELRQFMQSNKAERFQSRYDWFVFDRLIYDRAVQYMLDNAPHGNVFQYPHSIDKFTLAERALKTHEIFAEKRRKFVERYLAS